MTPLRLLSPGERDVMKLMAEGASNQAIAHELCCSVKTVESRVSSIFMKLDLRECVNSNRRVAAVLLWIAPGSMPGA